MTIIDLMSKKKLLIYLSDFFFRSPAIARGVFKIPQLTRQHYNIDVYSQMDDRNDNSYEEVNDFKCHTSVVLRFSHYFVLKIIDCIFISKD